MSRIWTAIGLHRNSGKYERLEFTASYDSVVAVQQFRYDYPSVQLVAMMPGIRTECMTFDADPPANTGTGNVDPFSMPDLT